MTGEALAAFIIDEFEAGSPPGQVTEDPADFGGITRWGITRPYVARYLRVPVDEVPKTVIRDLTRERAIEILIEMELMRPGLWAIPDWRPRLATVDFNFNAGQDDGTPTLQRVLGVAPDGAFGPVTRDAVATADPVATAVRIVEARLLFHARKSNAGARCVTCRLPSQKKWLGGWVTRCARILQEVTTP